MNLRAVFTVPAILLLLSAAAFAATAGDDEKEEPKKSYLYEWTDEKGDVHISDDAGSVPEQYRQKVRKTEVRKSEGENRNSRAREGAPPPERGYRRDAEEAGKAEWQGRIREWKEKLSRAEKRYQDLDEEWKTLYGRWGGAAYAPPDTKTRVKEIQQEMETVKKEQDEARNMLESVIPEEARKAGVPPGWLRE